MVSQLSFFLPSKRIATSSMVSLNFKMGILTSVLQ
jgi:hypothetical protein